MAKYTYPAIVTPEGKGYFTISFPDINCYVAGSSLEGAMKSAEETLKLMMEDYEKKNSEIPAPSDPSEVDLSDIETLEMISCETE